MNRSITMQPADNTWLIIHDLRQIIEYSPVSSVLDLVVSISHADAAHLYWLDPAVYELRLVSASSTSEDCRIPRVSLEFRQSAKIWVEGLGQAGVLSTGDPHFASFPETVAAEISRLLIFPLRAEQKLAGVLTLSRKDARPYASAEIEPAGKLCDALVAAMKELESRREVDLLQARLRSARQENAQLEKRLAERKLVERAKGILQAHHRW
jgi:GAF domain-containing protein